MDIMILKSPSNIILIFVYKTLPKGEKKKFLLIRKTALQMNLEFGEKIGRKKKECMKCCYEML